MSITDKRLEREIAEDRFHRGLEEFGTFIGFAVPEVRAMTDEEIKKAQARLDRLLGIISS